MLGAFREALNRGKMKNDRIDEFVSKYVVSGRMFVVSDIEYISHIPNVQYDTYSHCIGYVDSEEELVMFSLMGIPYTIYRAEVIDTVLRDALRTNYVDPNDIEDLFRVLLVEHKHSIDVDKFIGLLGRSSYPR